MRLKVDCVSKTKQIIVFKTKQNKTLTRILVFLHFCKSNLQNTFLV